MAVVGPGSAAPWRGWRRRLDAVVLDASGAAVHYWRRTDRPDRPWTRGEVISVAATAPALLASGGPPWRPWLVATVPEAGGTASYRRTGAGPWLPCPRLVEPASGGRGDRRLVDVAGSVFEEFRLPDGQWFRVGCLRLADHAPAVIASEESLPVAWVSGGPRRDAWPSLSDSVATSGIRGTDLGVRVEVAGRSLLLCGDTVWAHRPWLWARDALAEVVEDGPPGTGLPRVVFHGSPLRLVGPGVTRRAYDVPLDAFDHDGRCYALFSSNHHQRQRVMGRSVLGWSAPPVVDPDARRRPLRFGGLGTFSSDRFVNVQVHSDGDDAWVWGSGAYRASELCLARFPLARLQQVRSWRDDLPAALGVRYWTAAGWVPDEHAAAPVLPGAFGEFSLRWVPALGRYLLLATTGPEDPLGLGVVLRSATTPWGPWSQRLRLLDWFTTGRAPDSGFLRSHAADPRGDRLFPAQAASLGAGYAPYLFDAVVEGADVVLRYTLSTWNPYQIALLRHRLPLAELDALTAAAPR